MLGQPGMVGRDVVGDVVEDQAEAPLGQLRRAPAPAPRGRRSAHRRRSRARSRASRSRPRRADRAARPGCRRRARDSPARSRSPAGLRCQTPISQTASTGSAASASHAAPGTSSSVSGRPAVAAEPLQPHRGVDLVDGRPRREGASAGLVSSASAASAETARMPAGQQEQQRHGPGPAGLVAGADAGAVVAVEVLVEQEQVVPVGIGLELLDPAEHRPAPVLVLGERASPAARRSRSRPRAGSARGPSRSGTRP